MEKTQVQAGIAGAILLVLAICIPLVSWADDAATSTAATSTPSVVATSTVATSTSVVATSTAPTSAATTTATTTLNVATTTVATTSATTTAPTPVPIAVVHTNDGIQAKVQAAFADAPVMVSVARCESGFRQYNASGNILYSGYVNGMEGIFQLYASIHRAAALRLGFDIDTVDGNIGYARHLFDAQGTDPWLDSFKCWNPGTAETASTVTVTSPSLPGAALTSNLSLGVIDPQVVTLQKMLNTMGFTLAASGPGSPGQETNKYGALTRDAVRKFQCAKGVVCSGSEGTTGYGFVGARTRAALTLAYVGSAASTLAAASSTPASSAALAPAVTPASSPAVPAIAVTPGNPNVALIAALQAQVAVLQQRIAALLSVPPAGGQTASAVTAVERQ